MARSLIVFLFAFGLGVALYPAVIGWLARHGAGQRLPSYGLRSHVVKAGTPTMGGLLFVAIVVVSWAIFDHSRSGWFVVFALLAGGALGLLDDVANVRGEGALGLQGRQKLALQAEIGVLVGLGLNHVGQTREYIPLLGVVDMHWFGIIVLSTLAVLAVSNAVNLTDGVDGLAASCTAIAFLATWILALHAGNRAAAVVSGALVGSLCAFLVFNWFPARVFMGDTGSMALGCALVVVAAEARLLWLLPVLGVVFLAETLSVIINVTAIRRYHHHVFRASPLHHHFELGGLREQRLVLRFAAVALAGAALTVLLAYHAVQIA